ncbi:MAG TPA: hypothetical protein VGE07_23265, partial [Herpetosiphonaceae bacterium]
HFLIYEGMSRHDEVWILVSILDTHRWRLSPVRYELHDVLSWQPWEEYTGSQDQLPALLERVATITDEERWAIWEADDAQARAAHRAIWAPIIAPRIIGQQDESRYLLYVGLAYDTALVQILDLDDGVLYSPMLIGNVQERNPWDAFPPYTGSQDVLPALLARVRPSWTWGDPHPILTSEPMEWDE